ncbi:MAG: DUF1592 domain-containing protein [Bdellovibrionales bacterium]
MKMNRFLIALTGLGLSFALTNCGPGFKTVTSTEKLSVYANGTSKSNPYSCSIPDQSRDPLMRLTKKQYSNTLLNLVGTSLHTKLEPFINTLFDDVILKDPKDFVNEINDSQIAGYQSVAEKIYSSVAADQNLAVALAGNCISATTVTAACRDAFIDQAGLKAFRRPLTAAEKSNFATKVFTQGSNGRESVGWTLYAMVLSPAFLMHLELGSSTDPSSSKYNLTPYEVASRLSYLITDSPPDAELLAAAKARQLSTIEQLSAHVDRLFETDAAIEKVTEFFNFWLDPKEYPATAFTSDFLAGANVTALNTEFARELKEYIQYIVFTKKGSFYDLMTSRESFARTPAAAAIYGHQAVSGTQPALTSEERVGLLMRVPVLATEGNTTHPILRGVKFRTRFLCNTLGLPVGALLNDPEFGTDEARRVYSNRVRTEKLTGNVTCMGCHASINPMGFAFENLDNLGRPRSIEKAYSVTGAYLTEHPIDTAVSTAFTTNGQNHSMRDGVELIERMVEDNTLPGCFTRRAFTFYRVREAKMEDNCNLSQVYEDLAINPEASVLGAFKSQVLQDSIFKRKME